MLRKERYFDSSCLVPFFSHFLYLPCSGPRRASAQDRCVRELPSTKRESGEVDSEDRHPILSWPRVVSMQEARSIDVTVTVAVGESSIDVVLRFVPMDVDLRPFFQEAAKKTLGMAGLLNGDAAQLALSGGGAASMSGKLEEPEHSSSNWYFSREEIEKRSPSRMDGIDLKKETYFRKSYCTFLQDLGMCLKVPQVTIATAIVFCHRFFLRQSHMKNDRHMIATICMFLAGKVEETPRPLRDVILMSYEIRNKKDPAAVARIKQKEVYEEQKELVLVGERLVLTTLGFDLNIHHPYKPLVAAIKKFKVAQNALAQVAWNFVNDGLRTSLCLQFKPHHIAAGAIFLAAKFLKVKLPSDGDKAWWQEFEVTPRQLEEVSNQMLELYEQNKTGGANPSRSSDPGPSSGVAHRSKAGDALPSANGAWNQNSSSVADKSEKYAQVGKADEVVASGRRDDEYEISASHAPSSGFEKRDHGHEYEPVYENGSVTVSVQETVVETSRTVKSSLNGVTKQVIKHEVKEELHTGNLEEGQIKDELREKKQTTETRVNSESGTTLRKSRVKTEVEERKLNAVDIPGGREVTEAKSSLEEREIEEVVESKPVADEIQSERVKVKSETEMDEEPKKSRLTSIEDVNTDRVKALKRRKSRGEGLESRPSAVKVEATDEEADWERELESGVEEAERARQERRDNKSKSSAKGDHDAEGKKERIDDGEPTTKRRRANEDDGVSDRKRTKSTERGGERGEWMDTDTERGKVGGGHSERVEDGELPSSSNVHDQSRSSPRQPDRRSLPPSGSHDKAGSPSSKRHRDHGGRRDGHRSDRAAHGTRERDYHQSSHHHHQHRTDGDRDRHHHKDRDWQDRDHKKVRHADHGS
ncbi:hypothetical protein R1sor_002086 [Riccia sorocarpa]|uniref:Cyclin-like domain-containing protein n=1 Tax=Riccia sorocarpa TaxID=122646 RepID=A0ABD3H3R7_9MARC